MAEALRLSALEAEASEAQRPARERQRLEEEEDELQLVLALSRSLADVPGPSLEAVAADEAAAAPLQGSGGLRSTAEDRPELAFDTLFGGANAATPPATTSAAAHAYAHDLLGLSDGLSGGAADDLAMLLSPPPDSVGTTPFLAPSLTPSLASPLTPSCTPSITTAPHAHTFTPTRPTEHENFAVSGGFEGLLQRELQSGAPQSPAMATPLSAPPPSSCPSATASAHWASGTPGAGGVSDNGGAMVDLA